MKCVRSHKSEHNIYSEIVFMLSSQDKLTDIIIVGVHLPVVYTQTCLNLTKLIVVNVVSVSFACLFFYCPTGEQVTF